MRQTSAAYATVMERVYGQIREDILSGKLHPGEKLNISRIQKSCGASSSPVREALNRLATDGLLEYTSNVGMRVIRLEKKDLAEIFSLLEEFDVIAMKFSLRSSRKDLLLTELEATQAACEENITTDQWDEFSNRFHFLFYKYADNQRLIEASTRIRTQLCFFDASEDSRSAICEQHKEMLEALKAGDQRRAEQILRDHIHSAYLKTFFRF